MHNLPPWRDIHCAAILYNQVKPQRSHGAILWVPWVFLFPFREDFVTLLSFSLWYSWWQPENLVSVSMRIIKSHFFICYWNSISHRTSEINSLPLLRKTRLWRIVCCSFYYGCDNANPQKSIYVCLLTKMSHVNSRVSLLFVWIYMFNAVTLRFHDQNYCRK